MSTKELIISILEENKGQYLSGEAIGKKLHISRAAVSKAIKELKNNGYTILSVNKKGTVFLLKVILFRLLKLKKTLNMIMRL